MYENIFSSSEGVDCVGRVIKEQCGSTAYEITKTLLESAVKRGEEIMKEMKGEESEDDDDDEQEQQSTLPENGKFLELPNQDRIYRSALLL